MARKRTAGSEPEEQVMDETQLSGTQPEADTIDDPGDGPLTHVRFLRVYSCADYLVQSGTIWPKAQAGRFLEDALNIGAAVLCTEAGTNADGSDGPPSMPRHTNVQIDAREVRDPSMAGIFQARGQGGNPQ